MNDYLAKIDITRRQTVHSDHLSFVEESVETEYRLVKADTRGLAAVAAEREYEDYVGTNKTVKVTILETIYG